MPSTLSCPFLLQYLTPCRYKNALCFIRAASVQFSLVTESCQLLATTWTTACQTSLSITKSWSLLELMSIESLMSSNHLILCRPLLLLPSIFPSIRVFSSESVLHIRWPKYLNFSFSISPFNEYSGLISFRMDWLCVLAVQGTLKSLLQLHSSKTSILWCSALPRGIFTHGLQWKQCLNHWTAKESLCSCVRVQSCLTLCNPLHCRPPDSSVHGIFQARILEWAVISSSEGSS